MMDVVSVSDYKNLSNKGIFGWHAVQDKSGDGVRTARICQAREYADGML